MLDIIFSILDDFQYIIFTIFIILIAISWVNFIVRKTYKIPGYRIRTVSKIKNKEINEIIEDVKVMEGIEFEEFCTWLFKSLGEYKAVELTPAMNDEGKDIILTDMEDDKIYVECKRYTDKATFNEEIMIGREICQKLVGAMVSDNIKEAFIITTGNIHQNAWDYIVKLENNTDIKVDILTIQDIRKMLVKINNKGLDFAWS